MHEAVLITGLGAVSGLARDAGTLWQRALRGECGARTVELFDPARHRTTLAAQVHETDWPVPFRRMARADRFGCTAAAEATAGIDRALLRTRRCGVFFGSSTGALFEGERFLQHLLAQGEGDLHTIVGLQNDGPGNAVAQAFGVGGPVLTFSTACTSANVAIGAALDALQSGEVDLALAGGADELCEITYAGFNSLRAIDKAPSRPFRQDRAGLLLGEGSGVLLLETATHAVARGVAPIAELVAAGRSCDAQHVSAPDPTGAGAAAAIAAALREAGLTADDVTFVNAHGTGTPHNDTAEAAALRAVFGERTARLPVTSTKSMVGHLLGAAGGIEAVLTALSIRDRLLPPTAGEQPADPELGLDVVLHGARALPEHNVGLSTNLAFGGNNAVILLRSAT